MLLVDNPIDLAEHTGRELAPSEWLAIDQAMIDKFAEATGDDQWIHVDVERAKREMPGGATIAHGYLTLSLLPRLIEQTYRVANLGRSLNYGANRIRFTNSVAVGSRLRLRLTILSVEAVDGDGARITSHCTVEIEGEQRPALVAEVISQIYPYTGEQ
jgi:acyl dehydratase